MLRRLCFAPLLIFIFVICGIPYVISAGVCWIFTGHANVNITWPEWS